MPLFVRSILQRYMPLVPGNITARGITSIGNRSRASTPHNRCTRAEAVLLKNPRHEPAHPGLMLTRGDVGDGRSGRRANRAGNFCAERVPEWTLGAGRHARGKLGRESIRDHVVRVIACSNVCGRSSWDWDFLNLYDFVALYPVAACWPTQKKAA
jgi:hypothetical protein